MDSRICYLDGVLTVIGEALVDVVVTELAAPRVHVGGSPMNVAVGLARLGHAVQFVGRYGDDPYGRLIAEHLRANSVLTTFTPDRHPTSVARAILDPVGRASYTFELVWELPSLRDRLPILLEGTTLLHTGSIATVLEPGARDVLDAVEFAHPRATISFDPNCRPSIVSDRNYTRAQAERFVALSDVVKASDEDLAWLYPDRSVEESARAWLAMGPAITVVTRGSGGPWAVVAAGEASARVPPAPVTDTVGAGDSFMSALLGALVDRELVGSGRRDALRGISVNELEAVLEYAARAAVITVGRAGANPPTRAELEQAFRQPPA